MKNRPFGKTGLTVSPICVGTSPLGSFPAQYGYEVSTDQAIATMLEVFRGPFNFIDTSNEYGGGESERRIGMATERAGGLPDGYLLATKMDPLPGTTDFSEERVRASVKESLERLGLDRLELVYLHDPEKISFEEGIAPGGPLQALVKLRDEGVIRHLGVAGGPIDLMLNYLSTDEFEAVISHNRYTLVDQSALPLIDEADRRGIAFVNGAPYGGGMLVKGPDEHPNYCYAPASEATKERVRQMQQILAPHDIPLAAAALQFSLREPRIASTIVGMSAPERIAQTVRFAEWEIPESVWAQLEPLAAVGRDGFEN
ncbi:aldo/keto reductase [Pseudarthrobacter sp. AL07]|uniref:aldo/keto reductase n=1 Tax=unclassified Pseudarthrobacter TaxID=2647000 RepID=UPI00249A6F58|nr:MULTISPECIES: aldo/keto reductase [unclassified Pseudarthrobacter]MDI3195527.1 aldo/keto reductase [Pseudarthrobacter sp. AL20]MDI3209635.1 aldo/keto reductase [Pseudarthrobacter sp. AL07]